MAQATGSKMPNFTVIFTHGRESGPWGTKIRALAKVAEQVGCRVISRDDTDNRDPELRVVRLMDEVKSIDGPVVLVGSSMGGYVSLVASDELEAHAIFLLAPALYIPNYKKQRYCSTHKHLEIVHGWSDEVIPVENSIRLAKEADCTLHLIKGDHRLNRSIETVEDLFRQFLRRVLPDSS